MTGGGGGLQVVWERVRDRRQETIGGVKGFRVGNWGCGRMDDDPETRECVKLLERRKVWCWGVLRTGWDGAARARGHNARERADWCKRTTSGCVRKGSRAG